MTASPPRNPFYLLLMLVGVLFCATALAYTVVLYFEQKAQQAGEILSPSPLRDALRTDGWKWLLAEVAALIVLGLGSMVVDHFQQSSLPRKRGENGDAKK